MKKAYVVMEFDPNEESRRPIAVCMSKSVAVRMVELLSSDSNLIYFTEVPIRE